MKICNVCSVVLLYLLLVEVLVSHKLVLQSWTKCVQHWHGEVNRSGWRRRTPTSRSLQISASASLIFQYNRVLCKSTPTIPLKADEKCTIHLPPVGKVSKKTYLFGTLSQTSDPTHPPRTFGTIFGALKHHEMARYDLPTYVLHVLGHFWMFAVKITEWIFSLKSLGLLTWTWTHLPIVWDKVPNKFVFF